MTPFDGRSYQERFDALAASGTDVHGEAAFVASFAPASVLDAGCGTGRVAIELARRGIEVVGVDLDASMLSEARRRAPSLLWIEADLAQLALGRVFDLVVLAGNVPLFCPEAGRVALCSACAAHVAPGGRLVAGFQLGRGFQLSDYDDALADSGLVLAERYGTWDRKPFESDREDYAVSVHHHAAP